MSKFRALASAATLGLLLIAGAAIAADEAKAPALQRVEAKRVCMVNDQVFDRDMIPVEFEAKTYYGCCNMCKARLTQDAEARTAKDPISGKPVDKALAVFGALPDHTVLYFESEKTFEEYLKKNG